MEVKSLDLVAAQRRRGQEACVLINTPGCTFVRESDLILGRYVCSQREAVRKNFPRLGNGAEELP